MSLEQAYYAAQTPQHHLCREAQEEISSPVTCRPLHPTNCVFIESVPLELSTTVVQNWGMKLQHSPIFVVMPEAEDKRFLRFVGLVVLQIG
jgi:hypothetical protein